MHFGRRSDQSAITVDKTVRIIQRVPGKEKKRRHFFSFFSNKQSSPSAKTGKKRLVLVIDKRQKFVISIILLSVALFLTEYTGYQIVNSGVYVSFLLGMLANVFLYWALRQDVKGNFTYNLFILPFFYSLAFGLFYFLVPARYLSRIILTTLYAFGLYSLFLSQNIFVVASIRTIALLSGARIVSFVLTLLSFFFLTNIIYTLHLSVIPTVLLIAFSSYLLIQHSLWTYTLQKTVSTMRTWMLGLTMCMAEAAMVLWFWPSSPTVISLFLTGLLYTIVGLSHVWIEKRLFRSVLWEYIWVSVIVFFVLVLFTSWGK